jgi:hypothetical protein
VKVMVKVKDPKIFEILDHVGFLLRRQIVEDGKLIQKLA